MRARCSYSTQAVEWLLFNDDIEVIYTLIHVTLPYLRTLERPQAVCENEAGGDTNVKLRHIYGKSEINQVVQQVILQ
jgi:hypothetical protein